MRTSYLAVLISSLCCLFAQPAHGRKWTDRSGTYTVEAEFVETEDGAVRLRKTDGTIIAVPIEKLSLADQTYVRKLAPGGTPGPAAKPSGPPVVLKTPTGSVELPPNSVLEMRANVKPRAGLPRGAEMRGIPVFAAKVPGAQAAVLVTAVSYFTQGPLRTPAGGVAQVISRLAVLDGITGKQLATGGAFLPIASAAATLSDASADLIAIRLPASAKVGTLEFATNPPNVGDTIWMLKLPERSATTGRPRAGSSPKLVQATVRSVKPTRLTFVLADEKEWPILGGAPLLNDKGQVVAIHAATAEDPAGRGVGLANPATTIQEHLRKALQETAAKE